MKPMLHFNHAGAGLPTTETVEVMISHLRRESEMGQMEAGNAVSSRLGQGYDVAATLLGCKPSEVAFGSGHGQLYGDIIASIPLASTDRILMSRQEWIGNVLALQHAANVSGATTGALSWDESTAVDVDAVLRSLAPDVKIIALTWIGASGALINPAAKLGRALREAGSNAYYIIDASQALGQVPVDVSHIGCDALVACGRKFLRGPRGTALAYISTRLARDLVPRRVDDWSATLVGKLAVPEKGAKAVETAEYSVALRLGLIDAMERAIGLGADATRAKLDAAGVALRERLVRVPGLEILDLGRDKAAFATFAMAGVDCARVKELLAARGISIGKNGIGYTPLDMELRNLTDILRASVHLSNTERDMDALADALTEISAAAA